MTSAAPPASAASASAPSSAAPPAPPAVPFSIPMIPVDSDSDHDDFGVRAYRPFNRGNKLKPSCMETNQPLDKPVLWTSKLDQTLEYRTVDKRRRALVGRRSRGDGHPFDDSDPYAEIDFEETWSVPESPEEVKSHPAVVAALRDRTLRVLADAAMDMIEEEHGRVVEVARLADILQDEADFGGTDMEVDGDSTGLFEGVPRELVANVTELLLEHLNNSRAFLHRISATRDHILQAHERKKDVARVLCPFPEPRRRHVGGHSNNNGQTASSTKQVHRRI
ncbi:hypothetical protein M427DRAFT_58469 [Gonapodya prolifera JEL478]|uniref:Transcriptional regulatory protein RXT2 N-terminal domain-containing protein n=1 Tax=Gonapodya prolifera (strain JEL478) TaxID=1344416 RepID=A0A139AAH0_GONPJ|nr:hypothetical protein M427DRAFT_58469 [Gonapodya prolifera JEL478]|eukprot:KXS13654.1 hypothetical protein M427DRAFT_58469 [Gonapodya prolifera JEL478]